MPLIIGVGIRKDHSSLVNYVNYTLEFHNLDFSRPLCYKRGYVFFEWNVHKILFTPEKLTILHHFMHPSANNLFPFIKRSNRQQVESFSERVTERQQPIMRILSGIEFCTTSFQRESPTRWTNLQPFRLNWLAMARGRTCFTYHRRTYWLSQCYLPAFKVRLSPLADVSGVLGNCICRIPEQTQERSILLHSVWHLSRFISLTWD